MVKALPHDLRLARVTGRARTYLLSEREGCPKGGQACRTGQSLQAGNLVVVGGRDVAGRLCVAHPGRMTAIGWVDSSRLQFLPQSASIKLRFWTGTWFDGDNRIDVSVVGEQLRADGKAYWPRHNDPNGHMGAFTGVTMPDGLAASFIDEGDQECKVRLVLLGPVLAASDNLKCGGFNVSFRGLYMRR